jgi:diacylglycerol kinase family enzyme
LAGFLLINPRSGRGRPTSDELAAAASERGIAPRVLREDDDPAALAREADTEVLGIAGGDGSLAPIAQVAIERELPFVCIPFGTRNHFARDLGLDRGDPVGALEAFGGEELRIDVGRVGGRLFLNNVSLGDYASLVHRREAHRRRREALAWLRALLRMPRHPRLLRLRVDGQPLAARVVLVANNAYELRLFDLGARPNLTEGRLHLHSASGMLPTAWEERAAQTFELDGPRVLRAAIDGEPVELRTPLTCRLEPRALRVLVPPGR